MGAKCCTLELDKPQEIVITNASQRSASSPQKQRLENSQKRDSLHEEPATPAFHMNDEIMKRSTDVPQEIKLVKELVEEEEVLSNHTQSKKQSVRKENPKAFFERKNSLASKLSSLKEQSEADSQRQNSMDNKSVKSILKNKSKFSQFKKMQTVTNDRTVHFVP